MRRTSLAIIIPTSIRSYRAPHARGAVDTEILAAWCLPVMIVVLAGGVIARYAAGTAVQDLVVLVDWIAKKGYSVKEILKIGEDLPKGQLMQVSASAVCSPR